MTILDWNGSAVDPYAVGRTTASRANYHRERWRDVDLVVSGTKRDPYAVRRSRRTAGPVEDVPTTRELPPDGPAGDCELTTRNSVDNFDAPQPPAVLVDRGLERVSFLAETLTE